MSTIMNLIFIIAVGVQGFGAFPSIAAWASQPLQSFTSPTAPIRTMTRETRENNPVEVRHYLVRRESAGPPGESHSGRASSSPVGSMSESSRQSSAPSDLGGDDVEKQIQGEKTDSQKEIGTTPQHRRDPSEGGGQSHPVIKKRRGVLD